MFVGKFFKKHQKNILILLVVLAALFLLNRQFRIFEGAENLNVTIRPQPPRNPLISTGSSTSALTNVSGSAVQMTAAMKHICGMNPNAHGCKNKKL